MKKNVRTIETDLFGLPNHRNTINSKKKGNVGERACAKYLGEWVGVRFTRTPQSGAIRRINTEGVVADIIPDTLDTKFEWVWIIETKHLKTIKIKRLLSSASAIFTIWNQVHADSIRANKLPMSMLRSNHMPAGEYYLVLDAAQGGTLMAMCVPVLFSGSNHTHSLIGFLFSDVKKHLPYNSFAQAIKRAKFVPKSKIFNEVD